MSRYLACLGFVSLLMLCVPAPKANADSLKVGYANWQETRMGELANSLAACIEEVSDLPVRVYSGERMGSAADLARSVGDGRLDIALLPIRRYAEEWNGIVEFAQLGYALSPETAVSYSNDKVVLDVLNDSSWETGLELIGVGWQYGALVTGYDNQSLDQLDGKRVAGAELSAKKVLESVGGDWVDLPYYDVFPALRSGYIDGAIVSEEVMSWGLKQRAFGGIYWAADFSPMVAPIGIIMNKDNDNIFGGGLAEDISEECGGVITDYNNSSISLWNGIPVVAAGTNVEVLQLTDDWKRMWINSWETSEQMVESSLDEEIVNLIHEMYGTEVR